MSKSNNSFAILTLVLVFCSLLELGCNERKTTSNSTVTVKRPDSSVAKPTNNVREVGLTLPILDALFFEDGFQSDLKSKLQLTDQQIQQLKSVARASVADLSEDGTDYLGSARAASSKSDEQIRSIIGQQKAEQLYRLVSERYANSNLEALFPTQPNSVPADTRVVVNIPAFRMDVFQNGKLLKTYRIGIGYPEFPLPTGMRQADNIIFNPTWTPPDEPWVKGKVQAGKKVAAGSKLNPLGPIKIPIGEPSLIHGGKAPSKLGSFASHGCVGLTNDQVQDFAILLSQLSGNALSADSVHDLGKNKTKTRAIKMEKPVMVELRYETIVAENGSLHIYRDVYEHGTNTLDNAMKVLSVYGIKYNSLSAQEKLALTQALDEMNKDAHGSPIVINKANSANTGMEDEEKSKTGANDEKTERSQKGKVTKSIVGQKDAIIAITALQGKGYPAPVNFNTGTQKPIAEK